ncbi:hypothetical protein Poli38472_007407 [Pythium oligandrum]|uniref:Crinkler (CRN) family protein n=1 Tax=Pythium oligandrum TaxID=41045 RepID=A0A8K1CQM1_PYTOL|nr:hypothetical protein Poli38472_007407 [Pythium oligandrum]|eukprot:TMW67735.1 hypothetical protein Poli38472_007407 [Pythium oligandrum]
MTSTERDAYVVVSQDMASLYNLKVPASEADVGDLYWIMKDAFGVKLMKDVDLSAFEVYSNMTTFEADNPLGKSDEIDGLGLDHTDPMVVKLPWSHSAPKETVPKPKQTINKPRWKKVEETVPTLEDDCLSFVNRDAAVKALCKVHLRVFNGACKGPRGGKWPIALADNELGLGKNSVRTKLHPPLSRTVAIGYRQRKFSQAAMSCGEGDSVEDALEMTVNEAIAEAVAEQLDFPEGATKPNYLSHPYKDLVKSLAKDLGPVFIMLDEIGHGFVFEEPGREEISHEIFFIFCVGTLSKWMETKDVYFVLMPFLRNVGERKDHLEYSTSSFAFSRLSLQLIRPEKIQLIMRQTWTNNEMTETLAARWGRSTEAEIAKAAEVMYEKTCGHPRKMFHMFDTCATFDDLVVADADDIGDEQEWENVYRQLRLWQPLLEKWLPQILEKKPMDLTKAKNCLSPSLPHEQQRNISYAVIMERCHLGWEGTLDEAIVYALPRIMAMILGIVQPFREYVRFIETYRKVTLDHAGVWEWVCIKRFQELFAKHCKPGEKLPKFFGADTVFGNLPDANFRVTSSIYRRSPVLVNRTQSR